MSFILSVIKYAVQLGVTRLRICVGFAGFCKGKFSNFSFLSIRCFYINLNLDRLRSCSFAPCLIDVKGSIYICYILCIAEYEGTIGSKTTTAAAYVLKDLYALRLCFSTKVNQVPEAILFAFIGIFFSGILVVPVIFASALQEYRSAGLCILMDIVTTGLTRGCAILLLVCLAILIILYRTACVVLINYYPVIIKGKECLTIGTKPYTTTGTVCSRTIFEVVRVFGHITVPKRSLRTTTFCFF